MKSEMSLSRNQSCQMGSNEIKCAVADFSSQSKIAIAICGLLFNIFDTSF
jgi:hypothetical protein